MKFDICHSSGLAIRFVLNETNSFYFSELGTQINDSLIGSPLQVHKNKEKDEKE
jgi:hypothetical protein